MIKLYSADSIVFNFKGFDGVRLRWYFHERQMPVAPYNKLIGDYDDLEKEERHRAEYYIDELLTEDELSELREYLCKAHGDDIEVYEVELPLDVFSSACVPISKMAMTDQQGTFWPKVKKGYRLNLPLEAFYDLSEAVPVLPHKNMKRRKYGMMFANLVLQKLNVPAPPNYGEIIEEIYDLTNLFVDKDLTEEKPVKEGLIDGGDADDLV